MGELWQGVLGGGGLVGVITALGYFFVRYFKGKGGFRKDAAEARVTEAEATVIVSEAEQRAKREDDAAQQKRESYIVRELKSLIEAKDRDHAEKHAENRREIHELRNQLGLVSNLLTACQVDCARRDAQIAAGDERIAALEDALSAAGIPHRKWKPPDSKTHRPLPPAEDTPGE